MTFTRSFPTKNIGKNLPSRLIDNLIIRCLEVNDVPLYLCLLHIVEPIYIHQLLLFFPVVVVFVVKLPIWEFDHAALIDKRRYKTLVKHFIPVYTLKERVLLDLVLVLDP